MRGTVAERAALPQRLRLNAVLFLVSASLFGIVAAAVVTGHRITLLDVELASWLRARATPQLTTWMLVVTHLHSTTAVCVYATVVAACMARWQRWRSLVTVAVCVVGGLALNVLVKHAFQRPRPMLDDPLLTLETYSFPSGHVAGTTLVYGLLVVLAFRRTRRPEARWLAVVGAAAAIALVAFTRLYLGVHYLSDVIGGFLEAVAWLALCLGALEVLWHRGGERHGPAAPLSR